MRQTFRQEDAEQILQEAVRRDAEHRAALGGAPAAASLEVSPERLREMAEELGIAPAMLEAVLRDRVIARDRQRLELAEAELRQAFIIKRKGEFFPHLYSYLGVNVTLFCIWLLTTPGGYPWFVWPLLIWGLGLYLHAALSVPTRGPVFERNFADWKEERQRHDARAAEKAVRDAKRAAKKNAEVARRAAEAELDE